MVFTTLAHRMDVDFLREAYQRTRKDSAPGIDGVTAEQYAEHLEENLRDLHERLRSGRYQAPPVKRHWLAKARWESTAAMDYRRLKTRSCSGP
jgi:retron-type reverse transcriptase